MKYNILAQLQFQHTYYKNKQWQQMDLIPTTATQKLCKQYRCLFRKEAQSYYLLYGAQAGQKNLLLEEKENLGFSFLLMLNDSTFQNYTDIPLFPMHTHKFYFNTSTFETTSNEVLEKQVAAADQMHFYPKAFNYTIKDKTDATGELVVKDKKGNIVATQTITDSHQEVFFDLTDKEDACYYCFLEEEAIDRFYSGSNWNPNCAGILNFEIKPADYLGNEADFKYKIHHIIFKNRVTFWRYYIINNNPNEYGNYQITNEKNPIQFSDQGDTSLSNGQSARLLVAEESMPLQAAYDGNFKLKMNKMINGIASKVSESMLLPHANTYQIKPVRQADHTIQMYSDMYIYL